MASLEHSLAYGQHTNSFQYLYEVVCYLVVSHAYHWNVNMIRFRPYASGPS